MKQSQCIFYFYLNMYNTEYYKDVKYFIYTFLNNNKERSNGKVNNSHFLGSYTLLKYYF